VPVYLVCGYLRVFYRKDTCTTVGAILVEWSVSVAMYVC